MQVARAAIRQALDAIKGEGTATDWIDDNHRRQLQGFRQALALLIDEGVLAAPCGYAAGSRPARAGDMVEICAMVLGAVEPSIADNVNSCPPNGLCLADGSRTVSRHTVRVRGCASAPANSPPRTCSFQDWSPTSSG